MKSIRLQEVKKLFLRKKHILNTELCETFNVSIETVRRDLNILEKEGFIKKVYGGAKLNEVPSSPANTEHWDLRITQNDAEKNAIAKEIAQMIPNGSTVFLDTGTTVYGIASFLKEKINLTVITNSLRLAEELGMNENITVYIVGGVLKYDLLASSGFFAHEFLSFFYHIDYAILSCDGMIPEVGLTEYSTDLSSLKKAVLEKAENTVVAIDHSKFGIKGGCVSCPTSELDIVVTDVNAPEEILEILASKNVEVRIAKPE